MAKPLSTPQELLDILKALDEDTTALAVVVDSLRQAVKDNMTPAEVKAVQDKLTEISTRLKAVAADPVAPVPPAPPVEPFRAKH